MPDYLTKVKTSDIVIAPWSYSAPAADGCPGPTVCSTVGMESYVSAGSVKHYEPEINMVYIPTRHNYGRTRGSPPFIATSLHRLQVKTTNYLLRRHDGGSAYEQPRRVAHCHKIGGVCTTHTDHYEPTIGPCATLWDTLSAEGTGNTYTVSSFNSSDISDAVAKVQSEVSVKALTSYDFLTEIAEARELPGLISSVSSDILSILRALRGRYSISDLRTAARLPILNLLKHPSRVFRKLGNEWMQYRYAIMPLVYSYRDILKTIDRGVDNTSRCRVVITPTDTNVALPPDTTAYMWIQALGTITVRGHVFQHYDWDTVAQLSGVGVNPLATAWELIPYSFVVDWFVNVGDYITRKSAANYAQATVSCYSQRGEYSIKTWQRYPNQDKILTVNRCSGTWSALELPAVGHITISRPMESQLLTEVATNSYSRYPFNIRDAQTTVNPSLNWKRLLDSSVMANNLLRSFSKIFKR